MGGEAGANILWSMPGHGEPAAKPAPATKAAQ
jgi:hypothetical protein